MSQQDELDALQCIYTPDTLDVHIPPQQYPISLTLHLSPTLSSSVLLRTAHATYTIHALPPFKLSVTLPASYPAIAPKFRLEAVYLTTSALETLANQLSDLFQPDVPIVFTYADYILSEALEQLLRAQAPNELHYVIHIDRLFHSSTDIRVKRTLPHSNQLVAQLLSYARAQDAAQLSHTMHRCAACWEMYPGSKCVMLRDCRHVSCRECLAAFWATRVTEGQVTDRDLVCMEADCRRVVQPDEVLSVVDDKTGQRLQNLLLSRALDSDADCTECPRDSCRMAAFVEDGLGRCAYCSFAFCAQCRKGWHIGPCETEDEQKLVDDVIEDWKIRGDVAIHDARERVAESIMQQVETGILICNMKGKPCPKCNMLVTKNGGCSHMRCVCGTDFCWRCGKELSAYMDHYRFGDCDLYEDREMQRAQEEIWAWLFGEQ